MEENNLPLWKRMAIEKGIMEDPSQNPPGPSDTNNGKEKKKEDSRPRKEVPSRPVRVYESKLSMLRDYGIIRHFQTGEPMETMADLIDTLVRAAVEPYAEWLDKMKSPEKK